MSRIGKIARLPKAIREELNRRIEDGEEGKGLVEWLNGHAEVQAVLKAEWEGRPVNEPNLTAWRQGGFLDWRQQQESFELAGRLVEESAALGAVTQGRLLVDRAADLAALAIADQLMAVRRMEEGEEKRRAILKLVRGLVRLRKTERDQERSQREAEEAQRARECHQDWVERMRRPEKPRPFAELSDAELMRRITELRGMDTGLPWDVAKGEENDEADEDYYDDEEEDCDEEGEEQETGDGGQGTRGSRSTGSGQTQRLEEEDEEDPPSPSLAPSPRLRRTGPRTIDGQARTFEVRGGDSYGRVSGGERADGKEGPATK